MNVRVQLTSDIKSWNAFLRTVVLAAWPILALQNSIMTSCDDLLKPYGFSENTLDRNWHKQICRWGDAEDHMSLDQTIPPTQSVLLRGGNKRQFQMTVCHENKMVDTETKLHTFSPPLCRVLETKILHLLHHILCHEHEKQAFNVTSAKYCITPHFQNVLIANKLFFPRTVFPY